jgi:hypothetical protein
MQGNRLSKKYPDMKDAIESKQLELLDNWEKLEDLCDARKIKLEHSYQLQKYLADGRELVSIPGTQFDHTVIVSFDELVLITFKLSTIPSIWFQMVEKYCPYITLLYQVLYFTRD